MRFFKLHEDEVYGVVAGTRRSVVLILSRGGNHRFDDPLHVEIESSSWGRFRDDICKGCPNRGTLDTDVRFYWGLLCVEGQCPKEVIPG